MKNINTTSKQTYTNRKSDAFKKYLYDVSQIEMLSTDEEYEIAYLAQEGDEKSRDKLVRHNLRFVISVAKRFESSDIKLEDLVNEGNLGLIQASHKFDPSRGFKFITYAVWWIKRGILLYINEYGKTIRLPSNKNNIVNKIKTAYDLLEQKLGYTPHYNELIEELQGRFSEEEITFYFDFMNNNNIASLDSPASNGESNETSLYNLIGDDSQLDVEHYVNVDDTNYRLETILGTLTKPNEREIIMYLFGLDGKEPLKLRTIGFMLGMSSERIRQIRDVALEKLRITLKGNNQLMQ